MGLYGVHVAMSMSLLGIGTIFAGFHMCMMMLY